MLNSKKRTREHARARRTLRLACLCAILVGVPALIRAAAPIIAPQTFSIQEKSATGTHVGDVVASDADPGDTLTYAIAGGNDGQAFALGATSGALTVHNPAALDYETRPSFVLSVVVTDSAGLTGTAPITVNVLDVNERPTVEDARFEVDENRPAGTFVGQVVATDPGRCQASEGDSLTYSITGGNTGQAFALGATSGALTVHNPAALDYETQSAFNLSVRVIDKGGLTDTAAIAVTVRNVNDDPVANDDMARVNEDSSPKTISVLGNDDDPDLDQDASSLRVVGVSKAQHGIPSVPPNNLAVLYTPDANYYGPDSFQYTIHDGRGGQATATVIVTVNPINDPPTAVDDWASTPEETPVGIPVLSNDVDIDGSVVTSTLTWTDPLYGAISGPDPKTGVLTYTPGKDYNGDDHFTYRVCDDGTPLPSACSNYATVTIRTSPVPDPPVANAGPDQTVFLNAMVVLDGSASWDAEENYPLQYWWAYHGTHDLREWKNANTAHPSFVAPPEPARLPFTLMVIDSEGDPDLTPDEVIITVENRPPVADLGPDRYVNPGDQVELSATDSTDPDGDANLEYVWAQASGSPSVALTTMEARAVFTAPMTSAALTFRVYVYDSFGGHDPELSTDDVTVYVGDLSEVYFPHITRYYCDPGSPGYKPDLVVQKTTITPDNVQVQISNLGCAPVTDWFYVDVYVNPDPQASITVDDNWWALNDQAGIKWQVTPSGGLDGLWEGYVVAELAPGDVLVLNQADRLKTHGRSRVPQDGSPPAPWPSGTVVRAQVDTHMGGRVPELNEGNNLSGPATCP